MIILNSLIDKYLIEVEKKNPGKVYAQMNMPLKARDVRFSPGDIKEIYANFDCDISGMAQIEFEVVRNSKQYNILLQISQPPIDNEELVIQELTNRKFFDQPTMELSIEVVLDNYVTQIYESEVETNEKQENITEKTIREIVEEIFDEAREQL